MPRKHFGEHLMLDGYGADPDLLWSKPLIRRSLGELCKLLRVLQLGKPLVHYTPDRVLKVPGGVTGLVILAESHISIHTFPARRFLSVDVYSCKHGMDRALVTAFLKKKFKAKEVDVKFVKRGKKYPTRDIAYRKR